MPTKLYKRVYVWEVPVRVFHWLNALAITALVATGLIIGNPPAIMDSGDAFDTYMMGTVRFIHFTAAYVMLVVFLLRIYWMFAGNKFANWRNFIPFGKKKMENLVHVIKIDMLLMPEKKEYYCKELSVGHNTMASISYLFLFLFMLIMIFTGFGLMSDTATWWLPKMFDWVPAVFGGDFGTRLVHHSVMWLIILFVIVHVYIVIYHDVVEARGEVSSMISGFKFVRWERFKSYNRKRQKIEEVLKEVEEKEELLL